MYSANYACLHGRSRDESCTEDLGAPWLASLNYIQASEQPEWFFHLHKHDHALEISYVLSGKARVYCAGKLYEIVSGDLVIKNPWIQHAERSDPEHPVEQVCLLIDGLQAEGLCANEFPLNGLPPVVHAEKHRPLLDALSYDILRETIGVARPNMPYINRMLDVFLRVCQDEVQNTVCDADHHQGREMVEQVRAYLDTDFATQVSLHGIARQFHVSVYHLSRQFKKHTGYTINNYLVSCRIGEAQRRLIFQSEAIDTIARESGFQNLSYFYTCFRKNVGCTPSEYRRFYGQMN